MRSNFKHSKSIIWPVLAFLLFSGGASAQNSTKLTQDAINQRIETIMKQALQRGVLRTDQGTSATLGKVYPSADEAAEIKKMGNRAIPRLAEYLDSSDYRAQNLAVHFLAGIGGKDVIPALSGAAEHSPSGVVRLNALICLDQEPWADIQNVVLRISLNDAEAVIRQRATQIIASHEKSAQ